MFTRIDRLAWLLLAGAALGAANTSLGQERGGPAARHEVSGLLKSVDAAAGTITVTVPGAPGRRDGERREPATMEKTFSLAKNVEVAVATGAGGPGRIERGGAGGSVAVFKEVKLTELAAGIRVSLTLSADQKIVDSILVEGPTVRGVLKVIDPAKSSVTVQLPGRGGREAPAVKGEEQTYAVSPDAEIAIDDGRGSRFSLKEARLPDLAQGALVSIRLSVDMKQVQSLVAEGPSYHGTIKDLDAAKRTMTLVVRPPHGDDAGEEYALNVSSDAVVVVDDGKGKRLSAKLVKLVDVPAGAAASVRLSLDQAHVMSIRAEGKLMAGHLKALDADKGIIVITIPKGRGESEEKTFNVAKDANVIIDGRSASFADLKAADNPALMLRFSLDQQTVQSIASHQAGRR
jgi:hypothetical protein